MRRITDTSIGALVVAVALLAGCAGTSAGSAEHSAAAALPVVDTVPALDRAGWTDTVYENLTATIAKGSGQQKVAVFDFDNTTQARDVSEAVLAEAEATGAINAANLPTELFPPFTAADGTPVNVADGLYVYYEQLMATGHGTDPLREYSSLLLTSLAFVGRSVGDYVAQTALTYDNGSAAADLNSGTESMAGPAGRPFIYPQMADLFGNLRAHGYEVWIVSAGITWGVRWAVANSLNPMVTAKYGPDAALPLDHVVALSPLMRERSSGQLVSDYQLSHVAPDQAYINLDPTRLRDLEILSLPSAVTTWHGGKLAATDDIITRDRIYFAAGDSDGDMIELEHADNRLTINRMEKPNLAESYAKQIQESPDGNWMLQPTLHRSHVGFLPNRCVMAAKTAGDESLTAKTDESLRILEGTGELGSFASC